MESKYLQIVIMVKNSGPIIEDVIKSWSVLTKNFTIYDTGSTDGTQELIKSIKDINLLFKQGEFIDFEISRNESLELASTRKMKYILCIDDSYFFNGCVNIFYKEFHIIKNIGHKVCGIEIKSPIGNTYISSRLFTKEHRYKGKIHEVVNGDTTYIIKSFSIIDKEVKYQTERTNSRLLNYDIPLLMKDENIPRNCYYIGHTYRLLYLKDLVIKDIEIIKEGNREYYDLSINYLLKRAEMNDEDNEEKFISYDYVGDLLYIHKNEKDAYMYYSKAAMIYPQRAGESLFKMYLISGNTKELELANYCTLGKCRLETNKEYYNNYIPNEYKKWKETLEH